MVIFQLIVGVGWVVLDKQTTEIRYSDVVWMELRLPCKM